jgi:hypothetical protein
MRKKPVKLQRKPTVWRRLWRHARMIPRSVSNLLLYCAGIVPNSPYLFPEVSLRSRARGMIILINGCLNGGAWGYAALYSFHQWWLAIVVGLAFAAVVIHLDLYIVSGLIGANRKKNNSSDDGDDDSHLP